MSVFTIRMPEKTINEIGMIAQELHLSRAEYIRKAIDLMNKNIYRNKIKNRLMKASLLVRKESMAVNAEFSEIEYI